MRCWPRANGEMPKTPIGRPTQNDDRHSDNEKRRQAPTSIPEIPASAIMPIDPSTVFVDNENENDDDIFYVHSSDVEHEDSSGEE
jgi:hypothetical protein